MIIAVLCEIVYRLISTSELITRVNFSVTNFIIAEISFSSICATNGFSCWEHVGRINHLLLAGASGIHIMCASAGLLHLDNIFLHLKQWWIGWFEMSYNSYQLMILAFIELVRHVEMCSAPSEAPSYTINLEIELEESGSNRFEFDLKPLEKSQASPPPKYGEWLKEDVLSA